ncbi:Adenosylmethionine-8-amino-7-oxononanoate aminotransferase [Chromobacterium violaceum]|uniref:Adenosylmethionine-8-amino-7-oxononanoate aminotransferase n=1 Tax=Chromobacterium violaceum TaxID=536 RepID=A0A202B7U0_CHRVL|nr:aminotransferase class III-fold pyridoxal phosphate-dependent enzyme [Chromobacterium violaceum]KMN48978.1 acetylornithine aminotransferase [Chromobacterium violaceum]KMN85177.1 acetylornithine aminotransferase [Chromobacterium violaceum]KMN91747.1 acetylornithine aminotransferase [Chromobacterium violaceum]KMO02894.1 acetylornithine aminotransferase [Chromobacterium violaceum]MBP4049774.1 aspartate aminotransferase family protein [Chromobacterium violaceum]
MYLYQSRLKDQIIHSVKDVYVHAAGGTYTDAISGMFNVPFGYSCEPIKQRIAQTLNNLPFHPKDHFYSQEWFEASAMLLDRAMMSDGALLYVNSGSEAIESSIAMALEYHQRKGNVKKRKIICRKHSYHGATLGAHSVSGRNDFQELRNSGYDTIRIHPPFAVTHQGRPQEAHSVSDVENIILQTGPEHIAGIIFEPVNHLKGMRESGGEYLAGIRELCDRYDIVMITDEIVTGASRTGSFLNTQRFGVVPDIVALGKGISGGYYPASVMATTAKIASVFEKRGAWIPYSYSHTYASNPVSIASIHASLQVLEQVESSGQLSRLIAKAAELTSEMASNERIARAEASGLLIGLTLDERLGAGAGKRLEQLCFERKLIIRGDENWACLAPAYVMSEAALQEAFEVLNESINHL